ncbi:UDP-N-acetylglucosamine 2-epimerase [Burkholderia multivorans]|uniref:UDP-N-acetylglucosamine 2-epimerase (non-hydrolyzing) n=1 Tax=Burkholderia multivorans TaxID=87883 RepID=A0ABD7LKB8_9BURK|nr:UDP-N-acetylglucosamine 2-epimerase (non-hydrolyzing) [Burkholderia multivorans]MBU9671262.1 UDP-N-acetylglucosamine 2-epimerase (non-hydrolyzing) [Burkholderia multivorans]MDN7760694.1 UDP-N-acetylglucosamine 2-epimerase (non-hydrolyzing) [Burkholderia multivorans]PRE07725.1 UDP-N-acetylglucosamine 2-epimerase (non-hydrolyzing) [Burkholderia multivorans]SAK21735.1 UDP-N-acetylglucosamine 2-epimerase [Burkholderia multivorans]HEF4755122.1 UDP-N-acetylglucosamine 2-epimerase (non-hydrolyzing
MSKTILCVVGTRPEAIKMAPVILRLRADSTFNVRVLATAQHRDLLDQILTCFNIKPDIDLDIMRPNQSLASLTSALLDKIDAVLADIRPDLVIGQGDTTTVMATALACFYRRVPFAHVEAGLRTRDLDNPFPEEMNRIVAGRLAALHFAPTETSRDNLLREHIPEDRIWVTGNTVIDALRTVASMQPSLGIDIDDTKRMILVTAHRRENFGAPLERICQAIRQVADANDDVEVLFPVHPNPHVRQTAHKLLSNHPRIRLCLPLDYVPFVAAMQKSYLILSDSGGVQEEAPALGKPVLVLREETERPEAVEAGVVKLVGTETAVVTSAVQRMLDDADEYARAARGVSPYGDGQAAQRIFDVVRKTLV